LDVGTVERQRVETAYIWHGLLTYNIHSSRRQALHLLGYHHCPE
jgi:hypothetical protein